MDKGYYSIYGLHIKQFIELKRKLGFKFQSGAFYLGKIDLLAQKRAETSSGIIKEFADTWGEKKANETDLNRYYRIGFLVQLSSYIRDIGIESYIPPLPPFPQSTFIPYIYSPAEIVALFKACDELKLRMPNSNNCLFCMPALFRLLYGTGLRIGEALALKNDDVNLGDNYNTCSG